MAVNDFLKNLRKKTHSTNAAESELTKVTGYISTGSYAINRIISGDVFNGIPEGRVITFAGESSSGKSLIVSQIIANALDPNQNNYDVVFYIDSEGGGLWDYLKSKNVNLEKIEYLPVASTEECAVQMIQIYDSLEKAKAEGNPIKALVVLDSFGALSADKIITDATNKSQMVQDMGTGARLKNTLMSTLMMRVVRSNCSLIVINHVYDNPGALFTSKVKDMPGGKKLVFASHVIVQTAKRLIKENDTEFGTAAMDNNRGEDAGFFKGNTLKFFTVKNRIVKPGLEAWVYIDFDYGAGKWDGLLDKAIEYGFVIKDGRKYRVPTFSEDKKFTWDELLTHDEVWESFIHQFNEKSKEGIKYGSRNEIPVDIEYLDELPENDIPQSAIKFVDED